MKNGLDRRDALKLIGIGGLSPIITDDAKASSLKQHKLISANKPLRVAIIGAGLAGTTLAYRLSRAIAYPQIVIFDPLTSSAWYQPGLSMLGMGMYCQKDIEYLREDFIPDNVKWIKSKIVSIDAISNKIVDDKSNSYEYDYLIIASGVKLKYADIKGLYGDIDSMQMVEQKPKWMDTNSIGSIYYFHGAMQIYEQINALIQKATQSKDKIKVIFSQQSIDIKAPNASKSVLTTLQAKLKEFKLENKVEIIYTTADGILSRSQEYDKYYKSKLKTDNIIIKTCKLIEVDIDNQKAIFDNGLTIEYDFLHITPDMGVDDVFIDSSLVDKKGFISVDKSTLQHTKFDNIFAIGDAAGVDVLKSGAAVVSQVKIVVDTIRAIDEGKKLDAKYIGYGCDTLFCTQNQTVMFEAYGYDKKPKSLIEFFKPLKCYKLYWYLKTKFLKYYVMYGVMRGWA